MKSRSMTGLLSLGMLMLALGTCSAYAAEYPTRPITLMIPWNAGGGTDVGMRILMNIAQKKLGQTIVIVNKVGAGSQVGLTEMARVKPDGYYIGNANLPHLNTIILDPVRNALFNLDSFTPIINQVLDPGLIYVKADSPYKTLGELLDDTKKRPGVLRAQVGAILSDDHLATIMFEKAVGVKWRHVHSEGVPEAIASVMGGHTDFVFGNVGDIFPLLKAGQLRGLAVLDTERSKFIHDVPTTVELGFPSAISSSSRGILGPKGLPAPILKKLEEVFWDAMNTPEHMEKMKAEGMAVKPIRGEEYAKYIRDLHVVYKPLVEAAREEAAHN